MKNKSMAMPENALGIEKDPFYLRWWFIIVTLLFLWPVGIVSLITKIIGIIRRSRSLKTATDYKIPFYKQKTKNMRQEYDRKKRFRSKTVVCTVLITIIFLSVGCVGLTKGYLHIFFGEGITAKIATDLFFNILFTLCGLYFIAGGYRILEENIRFRKIMDVIGGNRLFHLEKLCVQTGIAEEQLLSDIMKMKEQLFFGPGAYYNPEEKLLHTYILDSEE